MAKSRFVLPSYEVAEEVQQQLAREYNGCSFNVVKQPLGFWISETIYSLRKKRTDAGQIIERVLRKAYNAGMLDDIKDIDKIVKRAFGNQIDLKKAKPAKKAKKAKKAKAKVNTVLDGVVTS